MINFLLTKLAHLFLRGAMTAKGTASFWGIYEPKMPESLISKDEMES